MLIESKSQLAKLMATENIRIEQRNVSTASFSMLDRVLYIPILDGNLSAELYDLFMGHEVGHALYTPTVGWHYSVNELNISRSLLNIVEDARIEKLIKRKYPGIRKSFLKAYNELMHERDFFEVKGKDINKLSFVDRLNLYCKCGSGNGITFSSREKQLVNAVENTETWDDVVRVTRKIAKFVKTNQENGEAFLLDILPTEIGGFGSDNSDSEDTEYNLPRDFRQLTPEEIAEIEAAENDTDMENDINIPIDGVDTRATTEGKEGTVGTGGKTIEDDEVDSDDIPDPDPEEDLSDVVCETDDAFREHEKSLYDPFAQSVEYVDIPELDLRKIIVNYKSVYTQIRNWYGSYPTSRGGPEYAHNQYVEFRNNSMNVVNYLVKEFELKKNADEMKRAAVSKTGVLDMSKLHSYQFNSDLFKKITVVPGGKSHGLVMFVDWSGSMGPYISDTMKQVINLVMFCRKVSIPFEVYLFSNSASMKSFEYSEMYKWTGLHKHSSHGTLAFNSAAFTLLNVFSSSMNMAEFNTACETMYTMADNMIYAPRGMKLGDTPLNETIFAAMQIIPEFKNKNKLQVVNAVFLTDGDGHVLPLVQNGNVDPRLGERASDVRYNMIYPSEKTKVVYRDPITKASVMVDKVVNRHSCRIQTEAFFTLLKNRVGCNIIGFRILNNSTFMSTEADNPNLILGKNKEFKKDKFAVLKNSYGYDEYYLLKSDSMDIGWMDFETTKKTTRGLITDFTKYSASKTMSRVVLTRFIDLIV